MKIISYLSRHFPAIFLPHDLYERHYWAYKLLGKTKPGESVLDVGGEGYLSLFAKRLVVKDLNIEGKEPYDGMTIPFEDKSFDYAVSIDTIEHIPKELRRRHLCELMRVAKKRVVFCAPINSPMQIKLQKALLASEVLDERAKRFVKEHLEFGLPTPEEIQETLPNVKIRWFYTGNLKFYSPPTRIPKSIFFKALFYLVLFLLNWLSNRVWLYIKRTKERKPTTNRFYGVIDLQD